MKEIRKAIKAQIEERNAKFPDKAPRRPWVVATNALSYVLDLPDKHLRSIRLHCDVFLGTSTPDELFMFNRDPSSFDEQYAYTWQGEGVDPKYWASEPPVECLKGSPLGVRIGQHTVNDLTALLQRYVCNLARLGMKDGDHIVEIGAGYGGLAEALIKNRENCRYTIVDLPETLIFSTAFLKTHFPDSPVYIYQPSDDPDRINWADYRFVFLPNYRADWLRLMPRSQWALNTVSFPEMEREQLINYLDILSETLDGLLMSVNYHGDRGDGKGVTDFIKERFQITPTPEEIMASHNLTEEAYRSLGCRPTILCAPEGQDFSKINGVMLRDVILSVRQETRIESR